MSRAVRITAVLLIPTLTACLETSPDAGPRGRVAVDVAPLSLASITDARYRVTVRNAPNSGGEVVWDKVLTSSAYGDGGGSLSYVGPCDASAGLHTVELRVEALYEGGGVEVDPATWVNPTVPSPLTREVTCVADADAAVTFDVTIARAATQGFFDVAVSFEDLFCSAKLDCESDDHGDLELLHDASGARRMTAVLGFACTGSLVGQTWLYMDDPTISCAGFTAPIVVDHVALGTVDLTTAPSANADGYLFAAAVYRGREELFDKAYWNVALGLDASRFAAAGDCTLSARATASSEPWPQSTAGFPIPDATVYPVVDWSVPLSSPTKRECTQHAVNAPGSDVATAYVGDLSSQSPPVYLAARFDPLTGEVLRAGGEALACSDSDDCTGAVCSGGVCVDIDECAAGTYTCDPNASCVNAYGGYDCACDAGWVGDGQSCEADECASDNGGCGDPTYFSCADAAGAAPSCGDIDECAVDNGGCGDPSYAGCVNNVGADPSCVDVDVCASDNGGCGDPSAWTCEDTAFGAPVCHDVDECAAGTDACDTAATCTNTDGGYTCDCALGGTGDGISCDYLYTSCLQVLLAQPGSASGVYGLSTAGDATGDLDYQVYCDMETDGGGWTLLMTSSDDGQDTFTYDRMPAFSTDVGRLDVVGDPSAPHRDLRSPAYNELPATQLLVKHSAPAVPGGVWARYAFAPTLADGVTGMSLGRYLHDLAQTTLPVCPDARDSGLKMLAGNLAATSALRPGPLTYSATNILMDAGEWTRHGPFDAVDGTFDVTFETDGDADLFVTWTRAPDAMDGGDVLGWDAAYIGHTGSTARSFDAPNTFYVFTYDSDHLSEWSLTIDYLGWTDDGALARVPEATSEAYSGTIAADEWVHVATVPAVLGDLDVTLTHGGGVGLFVNRGGAPDPLTLSEPEWDRVLYSPSEAQLTLSDTPTDSVTPGTWEVYVQSNVASTYDVTIDYVRMVDGAPIYGLCDTDLYFHLGDQSGDCSAAAGSTWGPAWNAETVVGSCSFDAPVWAALGPDADDPTHERGYRGFGTPLGLNVGAPGAAENYVQIFARDYPLSTCEDWYAARVAADLYDRGTGAAPDGDYVIDADGLAGAAAPATSPCEMAADVSCRNGVLDGDETDLDCGGSCGFCEHGARCARDLDCYSQVCNWGFCQPPACDDRAKNGDEEGIDCGGSCAATCCGLTIAACPGYGFSCVDDVCLNAATGEVWVPQGSFYRGCNPDENGIGLGDQCDGDEELQNYVWISTSYALTRTEVTAATYSAWCEATTDPASCRPSVTTGSNATYGDGALQGHPVNYVDWAQAAAFCAAQGEGTRLCTESEWEKAARGDCANVTTAGCSDAMRKYPWDAGDGSAAVEPTPALAVFVTGATGPASDPAAGASPYGAVGMAGNVWEWVSDWYAPYVYSETGWADPTGAESSPDGHRVHRGGGYADTADMLRTSDRGHALPGAQSAAGGLRCCRPVPRHLHDECATGRADCGDNPCVDLADGYTCACPEGYVYTDGACADADECATGAHACDPNAFCSNTVGGYDCACASGYSGDGFTCTGDACHDGVFDPATETDLDCGDTCNPCAAGLGCVDAGDCIGNSCTGGICDGVTLPDRGAAMLVFRTAGMHTAAVGGLHGADALCQAEAEAVGVSGTFRAWLSAGLDAADRIYHDGATPYVTWNGASLVTVATDWADLTDYLLASPIRWTLGAVSQATSVWTNTGTTGDDDTYHPAVTCEGFTSARPDGRALTGVAGSVDTCWTGCGQDACSARHVFYCFQVDAPDGPCTEPDQVLTYSGAVATVTVPEGCSRLTAELWGGGGGGYQGGYSGSTRGGGGGYARGTVAVIPGQVLSVVVAGGGGAADTSNGPGGAGGFGGGGKGGNGATTYLEGGGGGGYSAVFHGAQTQGDALLIAGGGGGSAHSASSGGGAGGGLAGEASHETGICYVDPGSGGGTQSAGGVTGAVAAGTTTQHIPGGPGLALAGGAGGQPYQQWGGGGGGGGYFGGGGGHGDYGWNFCNYGGLGSGGSAGGGGSGYADPARVTGISLVAGAGRTPPQADRPSYMPGVGVGGGDTGSMDGGPGLVILRWE